MKCTTYFEQNEMIPYDKYERAIHRISNYEQTEVEEELTVRKAVFAGMNETRGQIEKEHVVFYNLCMKNFESSQIYLEKKYFQNGMSFKSYTRISKRECEKILQGEVEWMKHSRKSLLQDFYLECTLNQLRIVSIKEIKKDVVNQISALDGVVFKKAIRSTEAGDCFSQFFDRNLPMTDLLNCDAVLVSYRRFVRIPQAVSSILHLQSGQQCQVAYSL